MVGRCRGAITRISCHLSVVSGQTTGGVYVANTREMCYGRFRPPPDSTGVSATNTTI